VRWVTTGSGTNRHDYLEAWREGPTD